MPVRIDDDDLDLPDESDSSGEDQQGRSRGWLKPVLFLGIPVLLLAFALIALLIQGRGEPAGGAPTPTPDVSESPASPSASAEPPSEPAESLPVSDVYVGAEQASGTLGPLFIGYDQTEQGAAAAALNYTAALGTADMYDDDTRHQVDGYIYATDEAREKNAVDDETAAGARENYGLDEHGVPLDPDKNVYSGIYPEYGAFQVTEVKGNTEVTVTLWYPDVFGVGSKLEDVEVTWGYWKHRMVWSDGDWRIADHEETPPPPAPEDVGNVRVSFEERAQLLGKGWELAANATEGDLDRLDLPEE